MSEFREKAGKERREEEKILDLCVRDILFEQGSYSYFLIDLQGKIIDLNSNMERITGYRREELIGKNIFKEFGSDLVFTGKIQESNSFLKEKSLLEEPGKLYEVNFFKKDGSRVILESMILPLKYKDTKLFLIVNRDITRLKIAENKIKRLYAMQRIIRKVNRLLLEINNTGEFFQAICSLLVDIEGFKFVWIGLKGRDYTIRPVAWAGTGGTRFTSSRKVKWDDSRLGKGPAGMAVKTKRPFIVESIAHDLRFKPWRKEALKRDLGSVIALPLIDETEVIGVLTIFSGEKAAFREEEVKFLQEIAGNISIGIKALRLQENLRQKVEQLQIMTDDIIKTVAKIVEIKDPYITNHQERVASLAISIAKKMGLSKNQIEGLRVAGILHDIGKIYIPAAILNKPAKLEKVEFNLVKRHAEDGYRMLEKVHFPWPIAEVVLQHHERINGSGYPGRLKDKDILLEAKILGVADVIEAMGSNRPYRTARSVEEIIEEIVMNRGILYDPRVVDVCIELFERKTVQAILGL